MPIPKDVQEKLLEESLEKSGARPKTPGPDMNTAGDRLRMASIMLGQALDAADKANAAARTALTFFLGEWTAAIGAGVNPATLQSRGDERMMQSSRPKTFGQGNPTNSEGNHVG